MLTVIYFFYGLAFFSMGLILLLESSRTPLLARANVLRLLAVFGLVHGAHEWLEMALLHTAEMNLTVPGWLDWLRLGILAFSFCTLLAFGLRLMRPQAQEARRQILAGGVVLGIYLLVVLVGGVVIGEGEVTLAPRLDALARYLLAVPAAALAGLSLNQLAAHSLRRGRQELAGALRWAAVGFGVYAITQAFVPPLDFFPARLVNVQLFQSVAHFPIQALRAVLAVGITLALMRAVQAVEVERQKQYRAAQQARIEALEQVKRDIIEREAMRRELLRHTVLAQEEERGRIARELHDETAQELTAFSLHLAALRDALPRSPEMSERMARLQALTQQMSNGIYRLVHDLRPAQLDDLGLVPALHYLAEEQCRQTGLQVDVQVHGLRQRLDPLVETVLFRVAQEALANAARYAHVQRASLLLVFGPDQVRLWVRDEGVGFDPLERHTPPHGWGLAGMRERAESAGGQMRLQSAPGGGTTVEVIIPLVKEEQQAAAPASETDQN